jgi:hypothetical protein
MKLINLLFYISFLFACNAKISKQNSTITIDTPADLDKIIEDNGKKKIIVSCNKCGCVNDLLKDFTNKAIRNEYQIIADTNCLKSFKVDKSITQKQLDEISLDFYNITLIKKVNGKYFFRNIDAKEVEKYLDIFNTFYMN